MKRTLNGEWKFRKQGDTAWKKATVPGCDYLDLMESGDIPDPFVGLNEKKTEWVSEENREYEKSFFISDEELKSDDILLNFQMLDTVCDVCVNGKLVFKGNNCFISYSESIKSFVHSGENKLNILFYSPVTFVKEKYKQAPTPVNSNGLNGIVHIRKPQCHFGWDWGPVLPLSGITGNAEIEFVRKAKIEYLSVTQSLDSAKAVVSVKADIKKYGECECEITLTHPDGTVQIKQGESAKFIIENPKLWWTHELSDSPEQPLYTVKAKLNFDGETLESTEKKIGIRKIELNRERDEYGRNFQFILNGVPLFIKGSNYIPPDSFMTRYTKDKLEHLIDAVVFSNMNMLRIWGGGYYGSDELYELCDKKGILVWQDFQFACQAYPLFDESFLENVKRETEFNVKRLCHHPSLALWNGNNEIEQMHTAWIHMKKYVDWTEKFFYHILESEIRKYDTATPYNPGSPVGVSHNKGIDSDNVGDTHLWGVWHGLKPMDHYRKRMTRFCSEFGFESLPDIKAVEKFAEPSDYSLSSEVFKAHQKCANGNDKMIHYIADRFCLPKRFEDYIYLSQVTQNECISDATEHWRRNKGRCNGSMYWQLNDCWGVCSWSSIDYYGNYKALQYGARHFNAPVSASIENSREYVKLFALNDRRETAEIEFEYEIFDFCGGTLESERKAICVSGGEVRCVFEISMAKLRKKFDLKSTGLAVRLMQGGRCIQQKVLLFDREKNLKLPKAKLDMKLEKGTDGFSVTVKSDTFARLVRLESKLSSEHFSDNYFDLLPNQEKTVTVKKDSRFSLDELISAVSVSCLTDIDFDKNRLKAKLKSLKVYASPTNIGNMIFHGKPAKDAELE